MDTKPRLHPLFVRWLDRALIAAEGGPAGAALPLNAASGVSLGRFQLDLAQQSALRGALAKFARSCLIPGDVEGLFAKRVAAMTPSERERARKLVDGLLARPAGAAWLARFERAMLVHVGLCVRRLLAKAAPAAAPFASSLRGQVELGCHLHQFGTGRTERLATFLAGAPVIFELADGTMRQVGFRGALDVAQFREFRRATRWGRENPRANESRHARIDYALRAAPAWI
ncbi:MAG: hypothetical protein GC202_09610 [Alphaproteobacteria bacterium]|nr:hypothetical protein [Alphaproteobacteria bacterium]